MFNSERIPAEVINKTSILRSVIIWPSNSRLFLSRGYNAQVLSLFEIREYQQIRSFNQYSWIEGLYLSDPGPACALQRY